MIYDATTTYPPPTTSIPPPTHTASTGAPDGVSWMVPGIFALVIIGATALRIGSNRTRRFKHGV